MNMPSNPLSDAEIDAGMDKTMMTKHEVEAFGAGARYAESAVLARATPVAAVASTSAYEAAYSHCDSEGLTLEPHQIDGIVRAALAAPASKVDAPAPVVSDAEPRPETMHDRLKGIAYSAMSWGGFNLFGDDASIKQANRMMHDSTAVVPGLRIAINEQAARIAQLEALAERLKQEAQIHAQEARTANHTIGEIYQCVTGATGEPGNWHGAEPVRARIAQLEASNEKLLAAHQRIVQHYGYNDSAQAIARVMYGIACQAIRTSSPATKEPT